MTEYDENNKMILIDSMVIKIINKILMPLDKDKCWQWKGSFTKSGYATFNLGSGITSRVHKILYELTVKKVSDKLELNHLCCNKGCINPNHLEEITHQENQLKGGSLLTQQGFCKNGHKRTLGNTYFRPDKTSTECKECNKIRQRNRYN